MRGLARKNHIPAGGKNVGVRRTHICVRKLAANSGDCAIPKSAALPLYRVTEVIRLASRENIFYEHPESFESENIKLQERTAIATNCVCARS